MYYISKDKLLDKIKGGWAGQVIGCTYGGPTEFKFNGTMIQDYIPMQNINCGMPTRRHDTISYRG